MSDPQTFAGNARTGYPPLNLSRADRLETLRWLTRLAIGAPAGKLPEQLWPSLPALAEGHGIAALVADRLPPDGQAWVVAAVEDAAARTLQRGRRLADDRLAIESHLGRTAIRAIWVKGAWLAPRVYDLPEARPAADLDLVALSGETDRRHASTKIAGVDVDVGAEVVSALAELGYRPAERTWRHQVFRKPSDEVVTDWRGEHPANPCPVEVHTWLGEAFRGIRLDLTAEIQASFAASGALQTNVSTSTAWSLAEGSPHGASVDTLTSSSSWSILPDWLGMVHLAAHTTVDALGRKLRVIQLVDLGLLAARMNSSDWEAVVATCATPHAARFVWPALSLAVREVGAQVPRRTLDALAPHVRMPLRRWTALQDPDALSRFGRGDAGRDLWEVPRIWPLDAREHVAMWRFILWPDRWTLADRYPRLAKSPWWRLMVVRHLGYNARTALSRWRRRA